jgi:hypothetical protein
MGSNVDFVSIPFIVMKKLIFLFSECCNVSFLYGATIGSTMYNPRRHMHKIYDRFHNSARFLRIHGIFYGVMPIPLEVW